MLRISSLACVVFAVLSAGVLAAAEKPEPLEVKDHFNGSELSGMDCLAAADGSRLCLLVDDEGTFVQFATLSTSTLAVGGVQELFDAASTTGKPPGELLGEPSLNCSKGLDPGEVDGEAIAHKDNAFLVVGSHGCSKKGKYRPETFLLSRITVDDQGKVAKVENTYRLSEAMLADPALKEAFGKDLPPAADGASIEAMTVSGEKLVIGFRSPAKDAALLLLVPIDDLFSENAKFTTENVEVKPVTFAPHIGFRDIEALPDGSFLALTGPDGEADSNEPYALRMIGKDFSLGALEVPIDPPDDASPEAIELFAEEDGKQSVIVISDGSTDGGPVVIHYDKPK